MEWALFLFAVLWVCGMILYAGFKDVQQENDRFERQIKKYGRYQTPFDQDRIDD